MKFLYQSIFTEAFNCPVLGVLLSAFRDNALADIVAISEINTITGLDKKQVDKAIRFLSKKELLVFSANKKPFLSIDFNKVADLVSQYQRSKEPIDTDVKDYPILTYRLFSFFQGVYYERIKEPYLESKAEYKYITEIETYIRKLMIQKRKLEGNPNEIVMDDDLFNAFKLIIDNLPKWYQDKLTLRIIKANIQEIITQIKKNGIGNNQTREIRRVKSV